MTSIKWVYITTRGFEQSDEVLLIADELCKHNIPVKIEIFERRSEMVVDISVAQRYFQKAFKIIVER